MTALDAKDIIALLQLAPHPEGGWYRETFRDAACDASGRALSTAIYFLLEAGPGSSWHRVDVTEIWAWHAGAPLLLSLSADGATSETHQLGSNLAAGERPQHVVPAQCWQAARSAGAYTLVSCIVAPGFTFDTFELAPADFGPGADMVEREMKPVVFPVTKG
jgi:uncharacterized protein